jgi:hypothetical protein
MSTDEKAPWVRIYDPVHRCIRTGPISDFDAPHFWAPKTKPAPKISAPKATAPNMVSLDKLRRGRELRKVVITYLSRAPEFWHMINRWVVRKVRRERTCDTCETLLPLGALYLDIAGSKLCQPCADRHAGYRGPWKRGATLKKGLQA